MKKFLVILSLLSLTMMGQQAQAVDLTTFQEIGVEFKTSTKDVTATVQAMEFRETKWGQTMALVWVFDNYARKKVQVKGTFSLHFETGKPVALSKIYFNEIILQPRKTRLANWTWEFDTNRKPTYIQWNPTKTIVKPSAKALRWKVPEFDSAIAIWCQPIICD